MKQIKATKNRYLFASATEDELSISQILLDLGTIIAVSESQIKKFTWGYKRRRSSLDDGASCSRAPSSLSPSIHGPRNEIKNRRTNVKSVVEFNRATAAAASASPDTLLSFPSSESDEETKHFLEKNCSKRLRKQDMDMVEQLTQSTDCLRGEIENVRKYYNKFEAQNLELNAIKKEVLKSCQQNEEPQMEKIKGMNSGTDFTKNYRITVVAHPPPLIQDQIQQYPFNPITTQFYSSGFGSVNQVGPRGIPDLNLLAEEAFGVDPSQLWDLNATSLEDKRARFAEARRMRRGLIKVKSMRSACGIQLPRLD